MIIENNSYTSRSFKGEGLDFLLFSYQEMVAHKHGNRRTHQHSALLALGNGDRVLLLRLQVAYAAFADFLALALDLQLRFVFKNPGNETRCPNLDRLETDNASHKSKLG